jgi:hypothetical protein
VRVADGEGSGCVIVGRGGVEEVHIIPQEVLSLKVFVCGVTGAQKGYSMLHKYRGIVVGLGAPVYAGCEGDGVLV